MLHSLMVSRFALPRLASPRRLYMHTQRTCAPTGTRKLHAEKMWQYKMWDDLAANKHNEFFLFGVTLYSET